MKGLPLRASASPIALCLLPRGLASARAFAVSPADRPVGVRHLHGEYRAADPSRGVAQLCAGARRRGRFRMILPLQARQYRSIPDQTALLLIGAILTVVAGFGLLTGSSFGRARAAARGRGGRPPHRAVAGRFGHAAIAVAWILGSLRRDRRRVVLLSGRIVSLDVAQDRLRGRCRWRCSADSNRSRGALLAGVIIGIGEGLRTAYLDPVLQGRGSGYLPYVVMIMRSLYPAAGPLRLEESRGSDVCVRPALFLTASRRRRLIHAAQAIVARGFAAGACFLSARLCAGPYTWRSDRHVHHARWPSIGLHVTVGMAGQINVAPVRLHGRRRLRRRRNCRKYGLPF